MTGATAVHLLLWDADRQNWLLPAPGGGTVPASGTGQEGAAPMSVLRYVQRTREPLVVGDATGDDRFSRDPYFTGITCCSLLAVPILSRGALRAVLLLENRLIRGAFTTGRLDAVNLIAAQLAVSLDNAQLYAEYRRIAGEQAALRRVATLVARAAPPREVFAAVAAEAGRLLAADFAVLVRYDPQDRSRSSARGPAPARQRRPRSAGGCRSAGGTSPRWCGGRAGRPDRLRRRHLGRDRPGRRPRLGAPLVGGRAGQRRRPAVGRHRRGVDRRGVSAGGHRVAAGRVHRAAVATAIANAEAQAEVTASRARIVAAADQARRRIERDLHDGTQQRLVSLALKLRAAQAAVPPELGGQLDEAVAEATGALEELTEIARGIHPAILAERGLRPALKTLARRSPIPVDLQVRADERLPEPVEVSAYYVVAEALTNAAKHSRASAVSVEVEVAGEVLRVAVRDDGAGGADLARGTGLAGLKDRVEALGGRIFLDSPPGGGTSLQIALPLSGPSRPAWEADGRLSERDAQLREIQSAAR